MVTNYFVLRELVREWNKVLSGGRFVGAYSHLPGEITLAFEASGGDLIGIRASARPGDIFVYAQPEPRKPKANVTDLFIPAGGQGIDDVRIANGDRVLYINLGDETRFEIHPYGSRPNVLLVSDRRIAEAFKRSDALEGNKPPEPRSPDTPVNAVDLARRMAELEGPAHRRLRRIYPQLGPHLAREVVHHRSDDLWTGLVEVLRALQSPRPVAYRIDRGILFSPIELGYLQDKPIERFSSVDEGVRSTVKQRSRERRLESERRPLLEALERAADRWARRVSQVESAMQAESRADQYEEWGHLLMANPSAAATAATEVTVPNILADGEPVTIPLDPGKSIIQNAESYYDQAKKLREERVHLGDRLATARTNLAAVSRLVEEFAAARSVGDVEKLKKARTDALRRYVGGKTPAVEAAPFRRFDIGGGYEVWVGRNAKENDRLTFEYSSKHDLWMHARGVSGSHAVLKVPGRYETVDAPTKERAAAIAAWFSRARGSGLVPVQITRCKYVTKPKGAAPGVVRVQNEEVILVEPGLPGGE